MMHMMCTSICLRCVVMALVSFAVHQTHAFGFVGGGTQHPRSMAASDLQHSVASGGRTRSHLLAQSSEFGAISASNAPPRLNAALVEAARARLPWEAPISDDDDVDTETIEELISSGSRWLITRQILTRLWVLPRDMTNGSWENYAEAANRGEDQMLASVPQLLRLRPEDIEASAKAVLKTLQLPPALLRREPVLMTMPPDRLVGGFNYLLRAAADTKTINNGQRSDGKGCNINEETVETVRDACKDTSALLLNAAKAWKSDEQPIIS